MVFSRIEKNYLVGEVFRGTELISIRLRIPISINGNSKMLAFIYMEILSSAHVLFHLFEFVENCFTPCPLLTWRFPFDVLAKKKNLFTFTLHFTYCTHACIETSTVAIEMDADVAENLHYYYCSGLLVSSAKYALNDFEHATQLPSVYWNGKQTAAGAIRCEWNEFMQLVKALSEKREISY